MIVIYGPQATGKTRNAEALRQHYNCTRVLDLEGRLTLRSGQTPVEGDLVLFTGSQQLVEQHAHLFPFARYVPVWDALKAIGSAAA